MSDKKYRKLSSEEISCLEKQGCAADDWAAIEVGEGFSADYIENARFRGRIRIGSNGQEIVNDDGVRRRAGLYRCELIDCTVGDGVFISGIGSYISGYDIGDGAYIGDTGRIVCTGRSTFGNGVMCATLNEGGGRAVSIYDELNAQTAYIMAMYRHRPGVLAAMQRMVDEYTAGIDPNRGKIGRGVKIMSSNTIRDTRIGDCAYIIGVSELTNGTVRSSADAPTFVGTGVKARNFICAPGAHVDNGAVLERSFVGEACHIDLGFVAVDSLFFANSHCANGEATSVFAGPYTVSHHRSTLLIAGYFSFFNAGSGSNQSNHLFRTGAIHQGIHERGVKFGSDSYIMLPSREGAYTIVLGKHRNHHDTSDFPYSYLIEEEGHSYIVPAANLTNHGTLRDLAKWPKRDKRRAAKSDMINFEEFTPYIGDRLARALRHSEEMLAREEVNVYNFERARIKRSALRRGLKLYRTAFDAAMGAMLAAGCGEAVASDGHWVDMAGMVAPRGAVTRLLDAIEKGSLSGIGAINEAIATLHASYRDHAYAWALHMLGEQLGHAPDAHEIAEAVERGRRAYDSIESAREQNARQDACGMMATGYGIDAVSRDEVAADFRAARGIDFES